MRSSPKSTLLIKHGSLGDIFLMLGALKDISEKSGGPIDVLTMGPYAKIFERSPFVRKVLVDNRLSFFNFSYLKMLLSYFRKHPYDEIVDLQNSARTYKYRLLSCNSSNWCQLGTESPENFTFENVTSPVLAKFATQLSQSGYSIAGLIEGDLGWLCDESAASTLVGQSNRSVILLPGASARHQHKIWHGYHALAEILISSGIDVFIAPGPDDMELCKEMPGQLLLTEGRWLNFFELAGALSKSSFVVGNDSGPTHLAASLGCNGVALFSSKTERYALNMMRRHMKVMISKSLMDISVDDVFNKVTSSIALED
ncbi:MULTISPECIES: glycosyltransferase family 9 protein [unclassified Marinobacterium]|uniref:glycosyltransferase family 9 protein n=1 Tax=unclassified Marinobacterium TaxID=2644139 RepID=UPI00156A0180|nr:Glycosyltransferase family 9 (heptosyltransferase) [Marinobacterium sp. xm-g-48]NRP82514.1 Glycosyltransferase family 9 (heptosyltransferase) [Marinobacterium sp. xm-d-509]